MNPLALLPGMSEQDGRPSLAEDLRSGRAGALVRIGLSLAIAPVIAAVILFAFGIVDILGGDVEDEMIAAGLALGGAVWCGLVARLWISYRKYSRIFRTVLAIIGTWVIAIPLCVIAEGALHRNAELIIAGIILSAIGATIFFITTAVYRAIGGRPLVDQIGQIAVNCPTCGYSMVGLDGCRCPECGTVFTIDELILAQDYEALRPRAHSGVEIRLFDKKSQLHSISKDEDDAGAPNTGASESEPIDPGRPPFLPKPSPDIAPDAT